MKTCTDHWGQAMCGRVWLLARRPSEATVWSCEGEAQVTETPACWWCQDGEASAEESCRHQVEPAQEKGYLYLWESWITVCLSTVIMIYHAIRACPVDFSPFYLKHTDSTCPMWSFSSVHLVQALKTVSLHGPEFSSQPDHASLAAQNFLTILLCKA